MGTNEKLCGQRVGTHLEGLDEGEGNSASQLNRRTQCSHDACGLMKGLRHIGQPVTCFAILMVLLAVEVMTTGDPR